MIREITEFLKLTYHKLNADICKFTEKWRNDSKVSNRATQMLKWEPWIKYSSTLWPFLRPVTTHIYFWDDHLEFDNHEEAMTLHESTHWIDPTTRIFFCDDPCNDDPTAQIYKHVLLRWSPLSLNLSWRRHDPTLDHSLNWSDPTTQIHFWDDPLKLTQQHRSNSEMTPWSEFLLKCSILKTAVRCHLDMYCFWK